MSRLRRAGVKLTGIIWHGGKKCIFPCNLIAGYHADFLLSSELSTMDQWAGKIISSYPV